VSFRAPEFGCSDDGTIVNLACSSRAQRRHVVSAIASVRDVEPRHRQPGSLFRHSFSAEARREGQKENSQRIGDGLSLPCSRNIYSDVPSYSVLLVRPRRSVALFNSPTRVGATECSTSNLRDLGGAELSKATGPSAAGVPCYPKRYPTLRHSLSGWTKNLISS
jgi:hypothetical protein